MQSQLTKNNPELKPTSPPIKRGRGRPRKHPLPQETSAITIQSSPNLKTMPLNETKTQSSKRGRGRPRKVPFFQEQTTPVNQQKRKSESSPPPKKIIRLRETSSDTSHNSSHTSILATPVCKKFVFSDRTFSFNSKDEEMSIKSCRKTS